MNAEIIAIGSELLLGQITNTNAQFLSKQLANIGVNVYYHSVVGDNQLRLTELINHAQKRSNLIIFTGGLGPTTDDLTKETIAQAVGRTLILNDEALHKIELFFKQRNRVMTNNNRKQAIVIEGSQILHNHHGLAPGMFFEEDKIYYLLLPGPPKEMEPMFLQYGLPFIQSQLENTTMISSRVLNFFNIGESQLETELLDLIEKQTNPTIAPLAKDGEVTIRLTVKHHNHSEGQCLLDELEREILKRVGEYFYGYDDTSLSNELVKLLTNEQLTISSAESITGGNFSAELTSFEGVSKVYKGGVTCYTNEAKHNILGVPQSVLDEYGAVSEQTAICLAEGVRKLFRSNIGISFTGVAGPETLESKPVGTVFIAIASEGRDTIVYPINQAGTRVQIQLRSVKHGMYCLLKQFNKGGKNNEF